MSSEKLTTGKIINSILGKYSTTKNASRSLRVFLMKRVRRKTTVNSYRAGGAISCQVSAIPPNSLSLITWNAHNSIGQNSTLSTIKKRDLFHLLSTASSLPVAITAKSVSFHTHEIPTISLAIPTTTHITHQSTYKKAELPCPNW